jgi:DNA-binding transcriptional regulator YbjK
MPPSNQARRDRLADAAMLILAREGTRGLTHRAVDAEAGEPSGTTSRYFRTRRALLTAVMERARGLHFPDLTAPEVDGASGVADRLAHIVQSAITANRVRHLAMAELFLESTRRPELLDGLSATRDAQTRLLGQICRAGGIEVTARQEATLAAVMTGLVFIGMTTPKPLGLDDPAEIRAILHATLATFSGPVSPVPRSRSRPARS